MKYKIVREIIDELTLYYAHNSRLISFLELVISIGVILRKLKKHITNSSFRKINFLTISYTNLKTYQQ